MPKYRLVALFLVITGITLLIACTTPVDPSPTPVPTALQHAIRVTVVAPPTAIATQTATSTPIAEATAQNCRDLVPEARSFGLGSWPDTDFCKHSIPYEEIVSGGVAPDQIASIDQPIFFATLEQADDWLADEEPVISLQFRGQARAYPLQVLVWHEIVNDVMAGEPIVVTYCPLCNSALAFERTVASRVLDFGTTGNVRNSDLIMYDRQTKSWWQQFTGDAVVGELTGERLTLLPTHIVSWSDFKAQFPQGEVLSPDTGHEIFYGETPYIGYDSLTSRGARFFIGELDSRLPPKMRVLAVEVADVEIAYPYSVLSEIGALNDTQGGQDLIVFWKSGTTSALYSPVIAESKNVGSAAAYYRELSGQTLTFVTDEVGFIDQETGSLWNLFGVATAGPLAGQQLTRVTSHEFLWFAWAAFRPDTQVYTAP